MKWSGSLSSNTLFGALLIYLLHLVQALHQNLHFKQYPQTENRTNLLPNLCTLQKIVTLFFEQALYLFNFEPSFKLFLLSLSVSVQSGPIC